MNTVQTYQGIVQEGVIRLTTPTPLPEGSHVYVVVTGPDRLIEERAAQKKATRWLAEYVGNMLLADMGRLTEENGRIVWRFGAFITARGQKPRGPIGYVDVHAVTGDILATEEDANTIITHGEVFARSLSSSKI